MPSVLQAWVQDLPFMQQSVLLSAVRNADGMTKRHKAKGLLRYYRRCILLSAFLKVDMSGDPNVPDGGSFMGTLSNDPETPDWTLDQAADYFMDARDEMTLHYYAHAMHAFEIVAYKHPEIWIRRYWLGVYERMCHALHMHPETVQEMNARLGDSEQGWRARNDPSATCSD